MIPEQLHTKLWLKYIGRNLNTRSTLSVDSFGCGPLSGRSVRQEQDIVLRRRTNRFAISHMEIKHTSDRSNECVSFPAATLKTHTAVRTIVPEDNVWSNNWHAVSSSPEIETNHFNGRVLGISLGKNSAESFYWVGMGTC